MNQSPAEHYQKHGIKQLLLAMYLLHFRPLKWLCVYFLHVFFMSTGYFDVALLKNYQYQIYLK